MIIHISGVAGSGKSYLCPKINMLCIDTDDIMKEARELIESSQRTNHKMPRTYKQLQLIKKRIVAKHIKENDTIVFVGMTAEIPASHKYFIKITDFEAVYKRLQLRELEKIVKNYEKIKGYIKHEDAKEIEVQTFAELSIPFPVSFQEFLKDYKESLAAAKAKKYTPKTQEQILLILNELERTS